MVDRYTVRQVGSQECDVLMLYCAINDNVEARGSCRDHQVVEHAAIFGKQ